MCIGLLGVTMEIIASGEVCNGHWIGEQGGTAIVVANQYPN